MNTSNNPTGYGPGRFSRILFDGKDENYELWEVKWLAYISRLDKDFRKTVLPESEGGSKEIDSEHNANVYYELVQCLDDVNLQLVMRKASNDGRKALSILREHYRSTTKPKID